MPHPTSHLAQIDGLTRRYALYSHYQAGLGALWAGLILAGLGSFVLVQTLARFSQRSGNDLALGFWRFLVSRPVEPQPLSSLVVAVAIPVVWFVGRAWIQGHVYERYGSVTVREQEKSPVAEFGLRVVAIALPCVVVPALVVMFLLRGLPVPQLPGMLIAAALALALPVVSRSLTSHLDRVAALLLCVGCSGLAEGGYAESRLVSMIFYAVLGMGVAAMGAVSHLRFRRARRELEALGSPDLAGDGPDGTAARPTGLAR